MNKKGFAYLVTLSILIILFWFIWRALYAPTEKLEVIDTNPQVKTLENKLPTSLKINEENKKLDDSKKGTDLAQHSAEDENFEIYDKLEKDWLSNVKMIVGADKYNQYVDMRNRNEAEKLQAYKEYHDYLKQKYGDKFTYNISEDQSVREKEINQRYLKDLLKLIGPEKFKLYTNSKDKFNEEMRKKNRESIQIEF